jgi:ferric-dicitrate binding protein FerR (iron transport regulator)
MSPETDKTATRISFLFRKYLGGTCSADEAREIVSLLEDAGNDISVMEAANSQWHAFHNAQNTALNPIENDLIPDGILERLHHAIRLEEKANTRKISFNKVFTIFSKAAAILILPLLFYSIYFTSGKAKISSSVSNLVWQTVKTPAGMQTDFLLPDGTHIWLNSGSVFKYPTPFGEDKREVELTGEAFFDVAKDAVHPFIVKAGKMNIEVKGTRFNVINYPDEPITELILESGHVRLFGGNYDDNKTIAHINSGELAVLDNNQNRLSVEKVDVAKYTAWKDGVLIFRDDPMDEVVRKLNRWFNVEIELKNPELKEYVYTATYRDETLAQILELLRISAPVKYTFTDRKRLPDNSFTKRKIAITK